MTTVESRDIILARIRASLADKPMRPAIPRDYRQGQTNADGLVERFADRVADYRATVRRVTDDDLPAAIAAALTAIGAATIVVPAGLPPAWLAPASARVLDDTPPLDHAALDAVDAVLTTCALAIAETGTIILDAGSGQGRRALSLLPDHHLCVVRADQIVADVPDAMPRLDARRPLTWISGPSATSDIELQRVEGVHGPRHLLVFIVDPETA